VTRGGRLDSVDFTAALETEGVMGEQLIYEVRLLNSEFAAIKSWNGRYEDAAGNVAASKAIVVADSPWIREDLTVSIPVKELELRRSDLPAWAEFGIYRPNGVCFARQRVRLPIDHPTQVVLGKPDAAGPRESPEKGAAVGHGAAARRQQPAETGARRPMPGAPETQPRSTAAKTEIKTGPPEPSSDKGGAAQEPSPESEPDATGSPAAPHQPYQSRGAGPSPPEEQPAEHSVATTKPHRGQQNGEREGQQAPTSGPGTPRSPVTLYTVKPGDSLRSIAREHYGNEDYWVQIRLANPGFAPLHLQVGRQIVLPPADRKLVPSDARSPTEDGSVPDPEQDERKQRQSWYRVREGDTLSGIAQRVLRDASRWPEIYLLNQDRLESPDRLRVGMKLRIPAPPAPSTADD
jgi:nucleoid-associated protein YgaU